jgi:hypothetical protein
VSDEYNVEFYVNCDNCGCQIHNESYSISSNANITINISICDSCKNTIKDEGFEDGVGDMKERIESLYSNTCAECGSRDIEYDVTFDYANDVSLVVVPCNTCILNAEGNDVDIDDLHIKVKQEMYDEFIKSQKITMRDEVRKEFKKQFELQERRLKQLGDL